MQKFFFFTSLDPEIFFFFLFLTLIITVFVKLCLYRFLL